MNLLTEIQSKVKATKDLRNNFGGFNYRNVESICEAVKPILAELNCSLILSDDIVLIGDRFYVKSIATIRNDKNEIIGESSAFAREALDKKGMDSAQLTGACSSYARKYALGGLLLLDDNKDIDGEAPTDNTKKPQNELNALKIRVAQVLNSEGVNSADFGKFFEFAEINKNSIESLQKVLNDSEKRKESIKAFIDFQGGAE